MQDTAKSTAAPLSPIIIEMETQTDAAIEELLNEGKGLIYDNICVAIDQMKLQGIIEGEVVPVCIIL